MASWRIWYGDGSTYSDDDGPPWDAQPLNVQAVTCHTTEPNHSTGHMVVHMFDYYWFEESLHSAWWGGEAFGLWDYLMRPGRKKVLFGRTIDTPDYQAVVRAACEPEFSRENMA